MKGMSVGVNINMVVSCGYERYCAGGVYSEGVSAVRDFFNDLMRSVCLSVFVLECGELGL